MTKNVTTFTTRASSINRALDQVGDKWCLLILQEVFWGINAFNEMMETLGVSRGVLADRLKWLQSVDCLAKASASGGGKRQRYYLTEKSLDLYHSGLMAMAWERRFFETPALDQVSLVHRSCGQAFNPVMRCAACRADIVVWDTDYAPGPGAAEDSREKKVRRRSSIPLENVPSKHAIYRNLVNIVGERWTANVIALAFHGLTRFDQFHRELPVATNILAERLRFLTEQGVFRHVEYQQSPRRLEYRLTDKGEATYPYFLALLQWGDRWCAPPGNAGKPMLLTHRPCGQPLAGEVCCDQCDAALDARAVLFEYGDSSDA
ncbi:MAG: helix-turn-helix domain-containing protein [Halioglobus sp.]